jgi:sterol desaturase/sphingolipid hydroxylase (fatty acid hydroxylase superfamily)
MVLLNLVYPFIIPAVLLTVILVIARQFEGRSPIEAKQPTADVIIDWKLAGLHLVTKQLLLPITTACSAMAVNAAGGGWINLRADGWWFLISFIVLVITVDFWTYIVHRAQHKFPALWAMHSLHHSAEALSMVTGARHFWLEDPVVSGVLPVVAIIFKAPPEMVMLVAIFDFLAGDGLAHLNMRLSLGPFVLFIQNPQYHRVHHSVEPQHRDKNFCKLLPLFDVIFGTAWKPGKDEFPKTGLGSGEKATGFFDGTIWPIRHRLSWAGLSLRAR